MEKSKEVNSTKEHLQDERVKSDWGGSSCPWWIFGNKQSADNDLKGKFEVVDDEPKD